MGISTRRSQSAYGSWADSHAGGGSLHSVPDRRSGRRGRCAQDHGGRSPQVCSWRFHLERLCRFEPRSLQSPFLRHYRDRPDILFSDSHSGSNFGRRAVELRRTCDRPGLDHHSTHLDPVSNTSVNPARSTGPAIFASKAYIEQRWFFLLAPPIASAVIFSRSLPQAWLGHYRHDRIGELFARCYFSSRASLCF